MYCKHCFKKAIRFFVYIPCLISSALYFLKYKPNSKLFFIKITRRIKKPSQIIMNMPNYFFFNMSTLF